MKPAFTILPLLLLCLTSLLFAEDKKNDKQYQTGSVVGIEKKAHERVLYYQGNDPITKDDPYYVVSVKVRDTIYVGEYSPPQFGSDPVESDWRIDQPVQIRLEKHKFYAWPPHGHELEFVITKKKAAEETPSTPHPAP